jgi:hypothetical protein
MIIFLSFILFLNNCFAQEEMMIPASRKNFPSQAGWIIKDGSKIIVKGKADGHLTVARRKDISEIGSPFCYDTDGKTAVMINVRPDVKTAFQIVAISNGNELIVELNPRSQPQGIAFIAQDLGITYGYQKPNLLNWLLGRYIYSIHDFKLNENGTIDFVNPKRLSLDCQKILPKKGGGFYAIDKYGYFYQLNQDGERFIAQEIPIQNGLFKERFIDFVVDDRQIVLLTTQKKCVQLYHELTDFSISNNRSESNENEYIVINEGKFCTISKKFKLVTNYQAFKRENFKKRWVNFNFIQRWLLKMRHNWQRCGLLFGTTAVIGYIFFKFQLFSINRL